MSYLDFKQSVLGRSVGDGECVALVVNTPQAYVENLFPGVPWPSIIPGVKGAKDMAGKSNKYLTWVSNDVNNANQLPPQGAIMVFDKTPTPGYTNQFNNPDGHTGATDDANPSGYALLQQNAPAYRQPANVTWYPWRFRKCLGWYVPVTQSIPVPSPPPAPHPRDLFLPPTTGPWHLYPENGPYDYAHAKAVLVPSQFGGLHYGIVADKGNGIYVVDTAMYGRGALYTKGSYVVIT